jgi:hypothetical protein
MNISGGAVLMKVNRTNSRSVAPLGPLGNEARTNGSPGLMPSGAATDQTQLSGLGMYLAAALSGSPAHLAKLGNLNAAVGSGQYRVDAGVVSESIIQHSLLFSAAW